MGAFRPIPRRVLLIDDSYDAALLMARLLEMSGFVTEVAGSAHEGIAAFGRCRADAVVIDVNLPDRSGIDVLTELRGRAVLIALTGQSDPDTRQRCLDAGFDHFLVKPAPVEELVAVISGRVENSSAD